MHCWNELRASEKKMKLFIWRRNDRQHCSCSSSAFWPWPWVISNLFVGALLFPYILAEVFAIYLRSERCALTTICRCAEWLKGDCAGSSNFFIIFFSFTQHLAKLIYILSSVCAPCYQHHLTSSRTSSRIVDGERVFHSSRWIRKRKKWARMKWKILATKMIYKLQLTTLFAL